MWWSSFNKVCCSYFLVSEYNIAINSLFWFRISFISYIEQNIWQNFILLRFKLQWNLFFWTDLINSFDANWAYILLYRIYVFHFLNLWSSRKRVNVIIFAIIIDEKSWFTAGCPGPVWRTYQKDIQGGIAQRKSMPRLSYLVGSNSVKIKVFQMLILVVNA